MAEKREVAVQNQDGLTAQNLILVAVLIAAGAVLKLTVSSFLTFAGMKPNFMIAMYVLAIILIRPRGGKGFVQAVGIGLIVGLVSQIPMLNATPLVNIASEILGAAMCGILVIVFNKIAAENAACQNIIFPAIICFLSTVVSGYTFAIIVGCVMNGLALPVCLVTYAVMVLGTATMNSVLVAILTPILRAVLKK